MNAQWIWRSHGERAPQNTYTHFRRELHLDAIPSDTSILIAADSTAQLWVNGIPLLRKVTRYHEPRVRADRVDAKEALRIGPNEVTVLHHNWGPIVTFQRTSNVQAGLWISSTWLVSDESWEWSTADEFAHDRGQFLGVTGDPRIRFPVRWDRQSTRLAQWRPAATVKQGPWPAEVPPVETPPQQELSVRVREVVAAGSAVVAPDDGTRSMLARSSVQPDPATTEAAARLAHGEPLNLTGDTGEIAYATFDFHRPIHGFPYLETSGDADVELTIGYGEIVISPSDGRELVTETGWIDVDAVIGAGYADTVWPARGHERYELPDERTARWLTIHVRFVNAGSFTLHDLGIVQSQYPIDVIGSFEADDPEITQIVALCLVHAHVTMTDSYVDTPGREDGQWIEDVRPRALLAARWFGDTSLRRLSIRTLADGQGSDGQLHPFFPSNYPAYPASWDWSIQWIAMVYDDYWWNEDLDFVREHWGTLCELWDALLTTVDGEGIWRSGQVLGDVRNSELPLPGESSSLITPWVIERLRWSRTLAEAIGDADRARLFGRTADRLHMGFVTRHLRTDQLETPVVSSDVFDPDCGTYRGLSQFGQAALLTDGFVNTDDARRLIDYAFPEPDGSPPVGMVRWNNPTTLSRVLAGLTRHGYARRAVAHLRERFAPYLPHHPRNTIPLRLQGPMGGPLPEYWVSREDLNLKPGELNTTQPIDATGSHGWGATPLLWLHEGLLGVTIDAPRGVRLGIHPVSGGLERVSGHTVTPQGRVTVDFIPREKVLEVTVPVGAVATLTLPDEFGPGSSIVWVSDTSRSVTTARVLEVEAGSHRFTTIDAHQSDLQ